jgi:hypothetical protein
MKCKILWINSEIDKVEAVMNKWLANHPNIDIKHVTMQPNFAFAIFFEE